MQHLKTVFDQPFVDESRRQYVDTMRIELHLPFCVQPSMNVQLPCMEKPRQPSSVTMVATASDSISIHVVLPQIDVPVAADIALESYRLAGWASVTTFSPQ